MSFKIDIISIQTIALSYAGAVDDLEEDAWELKHPMFGYAQEEVRGCVQIYLFYFFNMT